MTNPENSVTVESLSEKVSLTRQKLDELKNSVGSLSDKEKSKKTQELVELKNAIYESKKQLKKLKRTVTEESDKTKVSQIESDISQIETEYNQLDAQISSELAKLSQDVQTNDSKKGRLATQWEGLTSKDEWKEHTGKNIARTLGGVGLVGGVVWLGKKIFGRKDYQDEIEGYDQMSRKEKRKARKEWKRQKRKERKAERKETSFWDRWYGKALKWTGIGTGIYYVVHGIKTNRWNLKDFFIWKKKATTDAEADYDDYVEEAKKNPEKYKEYEDLGMNINIMYDKIWDTEINYFGADSQIVMGEVGNQVEEKKLKRSEKFEHIETKGLVPYSLDNFYSNVGELISYGGVEKYRTCKNIEEFKDRIRLLGKDFFAKAMVPFLSGFASFATLGIVDKDDAQTKMDKYFKAIGDDAEAHLGELNLFFRQYTKVLTYMVDKKHALALQEAKKIISVQGYNGDSWPSDVKEQNEMLEKAIGDSDWVEKNLMGTSYGAFMSSSILGASKVLKSQGFDSTDLSEPLQEIIDGVDKKTEEIIGGFDDNALKRAETKLNAGQTLDSNDKNGLHKIAQNIVDDMGDETNGGWWYDTFDYFFDFLGATESDRQMVLKESGLTKCFTEVTTQIKNLQADIAANPTKEKVEQLKELVGQYTSYKKELAVAVYAIHTAKSDKDFLDWVKGLGKLLLIDGPTHFFKSLWKLLHLDASFGDLINVSIGFTIVGGGMQLICKGRTTQILGKGIRKTGMLPCALADFCVGRSRWGFATRQRIKDVAKGNPTKAANLMKKKILDGILSPKQVNNIITTTDVGKEIRVTGNNADEVFESVVKNIFGSKYEGNVGMYIKYRGKINNMVSYTNKGRNHQFAAHMSDEFFDSLKKFDVEYQKLGNVNTDFFDSMLKKISCSSASDIDLLQKLVTDEKFVKSLTEENVAVLKKLKIKELRQLEKSGKLGQFSRGEIKIEELLANIGKKVGETTVETVSEARRIFNTRIDNAIGKLQRANVGKTKIFDDHIKKLEALKSDKSLVDDEMECFVKCLDEGFDVQLLPDLKKLLNSSSTFTTKVIKDLKLDDKLGIKAGDQIGPKLRKLLDEGDIKNFNKILSNKKFAKMPGIKNIKVASITSSFSKVLKGVEALPGGSIKSLVKFAKIIAKIL